MGSPVLLFPSFPAIPHAGKGRGWSAVRLDEDPDRTAWLEQSASRLRETWDNDDDDAYNALLTQ